MTFAGTSFATAIIRDVTERMQYERQLRSFIDHAPAAIAMFNREILRGPRLQSREQRNYTLNQKLSPGRAITGRRIAHDAICPRCNSRMRLAAVIGQCTWSNAFAIKFYQFSAVLTKTCYSILEELY